MNPPVDGSNLANLRRPAGVTVAAVMAILGAAAFILLALTMAFGVFVRSPQSASTPVAPVYLKTMLLAMGFVWLGLGAWGIATAVGLFKLRSWSRRSVLVFSALLTIFGVIPAVMTALVPLPPAPQVSPEFIRHLRLVMAVFYAVLAMIGGFWLFYFNRAGVRARFDSGQGIREPSRRPLSILVIAWFMVTGGALLVAASFFLPFPGLAFGVLLKGWAARLFYLGTGAIELSLGIGLLRLNPMSRVLAIAFFVYTILNGLVTAVWPGYAQSARELLESMPASFRSPGTYDMIPSMRAAMIPGILISAIPIWFLIARRAAFARRLEESAP